MRELGGQLHLALEAREPLGRDHAVRGGALRVVLAGCEPAPVPIHLVYPSTRLLSAKVRAFIELVTATRDWRFIEL